MKIFLSDLHLSDGKERDDFQYHQEFNEVVKKWSEEFKKIEIVLLGDIFDLIRTQKYYESRGEGKLRSKLKYTLYKLDNIFVHQKNEPLLSEVADITGPHVELRKASSSLLSECFPKIIFSAALHLELQP